MRMRSRVVISDLAIFQKVEMADITFRLVEIIIIQILSSLFGLSDKLCSRKFGRVLLEIALIKTYFAKIPIQNMWE